MASYHTLLLLHRVRSHTILQIKAQNLEGCTKLWGVPVKLDPGNLQVITNTSGSKQIWGTGHESPVWRPKEDKTITTGLKATVYQLALGCSLNLLKPTVVSRRYVINTCNLLVSPGSCILKAPLPVRSEKSLLLFAPRAVLET